MILLYLASDGICAIIRAMVARIVVDTSVFTAALIGHEGPNREILRRCLLGQYQPLLGNALFSEYEAVSMRKAVLDRCPVPKQDVLDLLEAFCSVCEWVPIYYLWRPNLPDEADNCLLELAVAGNAQWIVTNNVRDFRNAELNFPGIRIITPEEILTGE
ncbi:putative toxin-antitoxin system toxin component, PIN family [Candidatus Thiosymbion oneisti]|uniref:putative toxin-antitoxin system toxin component, PIN family n=1 Tax=Candidatus Thiosymbion oneisti TaxID=589554 RepID=UPI000A8DDD6A|nr:putative toxin-antitoxin system toxin component, PIN family [Candidatus Thiosymbion oneisti]